VKRKEGKRIEPPSHSVVEGKKSEPPPAPLSTSAQGGGGGFCLPIYIPIRKEKLPQALDHPLDCLAL